MEKSSPSRSYYKVFESLFPPLSFKIVEETDDELMPKFDLNYEEKYTDIVRHEQYMKYKKDYESLYDEYKALYIKVISQSRKFGKILKKLDECQKGSDKSVKINSKFFAQYRKLKCNTKFQTIKQQFDYSHGMLSHILKLINAYESSLKNMEESCEGDTVKLK